MWVRLCHLIKYIYGNISCSFAFFILVIMLTASMAKMSLLTLYKGTQKIFSVNVTLRLHLKISLPWSNTIVTIYISLS